MPRELTPLQKLMLINAHPVKFCFNLAGGLMGLYFLWFRDWPKALVLGLGTVILGTLITKRFGKFEAKRTAATFWGKIFLCYTTAWGFAVYLTSHLLIPLGFWFKDMRLALCGLAILTIGLFPLFKLRKEAKGN